jgi:hypothetical protein
MENKDDWKEIEELHQRNSYNEIEERVKKIFELKDYFLSKNDKMFEGIWIEDDNLKYALCISIDTSNTLEQEIYKIKYEYIEQLKEDNSSLLNQINKEEIANIWKPKTLNLYINNKKVGSVSYEPIDQDYCISNLNKVLNEVEEFEITKKDITKKIVKEIKYGNKKIKVLEEKSNKKNAIYEDIELNDFCELFNSNISYDYESENVYITL